MLSNQPLRTWTLGVCALALGACGGDESVDTPTSAEQAAAPTTIEIPLPEQPIDDIELVEDRSEEVADWLLSFSDKLRRRSFEEAREWFSPTFYGHGFALEEHTTSALPLDVERRTYDTDRARIVDGATFVDQLDEQFGSWGRVDSMLWKVKAADFEGGRRPWGRIKLYIHAIGAEADGAAVSLTAWAYARVERRSGQWLLERLKLTSFATDRRARALFTEVGAAAGVAHTGPRFGTAGNDSFHWNGAAAADVDADGDWDLFAPSDGRNFLYLAQPDGTYTDVAEARGLATPDAGTGAVFFDFDNDRDQDLLVGHVGWTAADGTRGGETLALYVNDGAGHFTRRALPGLDTPYVAYGLTVLDYDLDGWLDVYVCGYGRVEVEHNDSWTEATNGSPNGLLKNLAGEGFRDVAAELGVQGRQWSYAAAAADIDADGDADLYVANDYGSNCLYINDGGTFHDAAAELGVVDRGNGMGVTWGDLDNDARLDLYVSNMSSTAGNRILSRLGEALDPELMATLRKLAAGNSIFRAGPEGFERVPREAGGIGASWAWSASLADFDLDGNLDVFCTNGFVTGDLAFDT